MDIFVYGTLCYRPLLDLVLGHGRAVCLPARMADAQVFLVRDRNFPFLAPGTGEATGLLVTGLTETDQARLDFYEGGFDYALTEVQVQTAQGARPAMVYLTPEGRWPAGEPWSLERWAATWGSIVLAAAAEFMSHFGKTDPAGLTGLYPFMLARGWSRQLARVPAPQTRRSKHHADEVKILAQRPGFDGFFRIAAFDLNYPRYDGSTSQPIRREAFVAFDAALILPYDPATDRVLLIEQLRFGPLMRGDPAPWVFEPVAGLVDAGEAPEEAARREALEEAGLEMRSIEPMTRGYAAPGYSTEFFHMFLGLCDLPREGAHLGGLADENEDIRSLVLPFDQAIGLVESGEINAVPLVMMLLWLGRQRARLRASA